MPLPKLSLADIIFGDQSDRSLRAHRIDPDSFLGSSSSVSVSASSQQDLDETLREEIGMALAVRGQSPLEVVNDRPVTHDDLKNHGQWLRRFFATVQEFQTRLDEAKDRTPKTVKSHLLFNHLQDTLNRAVHYYSRNLSLYHRCRADLMILTRVPASVPVQAESPPDDDDDFDGGDVPLDETNVLSPEFHRSFLNMAASG